jgi:hypothetical protein
MWSSGRGGDRSLSTGHASVDDGPDKRKRSTGLADATTKLLTHCRRSKPMVWWTHTRTHTHSHTHTHTHNVRTQHTQRSMGAMSERGCAGNSMLPAHKRCSALATSTHLVQRQGPRGAGAHLATRPAANGGQARLPPRPTTAVAVARRQPGPRARVAVAPQPGRRPAPPLPLRRTW